MGEGQGFTWRRRGKGAKSCHHPELRSAPASLSLLTCSSPLSVSQHPSTWPMRHWRPPTWWRQRRRRRIQAAREKRIPPLVVFVVIFSRVATTPSDDRPLVVTPPPHTHFGFPALLTVCCCLNTGRVEATEARLKANTQPSSRLPTFSSIERQQLGRVELTV